MEVVILGAGLTGLSSAYHLEKNNFFDYRIFEKNSIPGGLLKSIKQDGFTFDYTGHLLHINNQYFFDFIDKISGLNNFDLVTRKSSILSNNILTKYPFQINLSGLPPQVIYECINGYIKRKSEIKKAKNFHEWVLKYFGSGIGKHFMFPFNKKMQNYDLKKITPDWTGRFIPKTTLKNILFGALQTNENLIGYNSQFYYPKKDGIQFLIDKLIKKIKQPINTEYEAEFIDLKTKTIFFKNGHHERFKKLITTIPLDHLLNSLNEKSNTCLKQESKNLVCNSVLNFNLGFNKSKLINTHWIYVPEKKYPFYRIGFWSNISKSSTPKNHSAIYGEISYNSKNKTDKQIQNLKETAINKTLELLELKKINIVTKNILNIDRAYVVYDKWRAKNLHKILNQLEDFNIYSIGRYGAWKYSSMQEAVIEGKTIVDDLLKVKQNKQDLNVIPAIKIENEKNNSNHTKSNYIYTKQNKEKFDKDIS